MSDNLRTRLLVAALGIPLTVVVVYAGGWFFAAGLAVLAGVGMDEFVRIYRGDGSHPFRVLGALGAALFPLLAHAVSPEAAWLAGAPLLILATGAAAARVPPREGPMTAAALTGFGALYIGGMLALSVPLRETLASGRLEGTLLFFFPVTVTWLSDTAAYLAGKRWGRRQLAPLVSPNKTWAGAVAGVTAAVAVAGLYGELLLPVAGGSAAPGLVPSLLLGLLVGGAGIGGDLSVSILKRECGVKDSSQLIPGHGGMLDRLDALLWVFPVTYFFLNLL